MATIRRAKKFLTDLVASIVGTGSHKAASRRARGAKKIGSKRTARERTESLRSS